MNCSEFQIALLEEIDGRLPGAARRPLAAHLEACSDCRRFANAQRSLDRRLAAALPVPVLSRDFSDRLRQRIAREIAATAVVPVMSPRVIAEAAERTDVLDWALDYFRARLDLLPGLFTWVGSVSLLAIGLSYLLAWKGSWLAAALGNASALSGPGTAWVSAALCLALAAVTVVKRPSFNPVQWFD